MGFVKANYSVIRELVDAKSMGYCRVWAMITMGYDRVDCMCFKSTHLRDSGLPRLQTRYWKEVYVHYGYVIPTIHDIFRQRAGHIPPTSVVNLIFVLANHAAVRVDLPWRVQD